MFRLIFRIFSTIVILLLFIVPCKAQQTQVLLVGTFHFDNPGLDASKLKSLDIKSTAVQKEIESIVAAIARFHPQQIFVEFPYQDQNKLNEYYKAYLAGQPTDGVKNNSEIYQLGFKTAKALDLLQLEAIDYRMNLSGTDSMMKVMQVAGQEKLIHAIPDYIKTLSGNFNQLVQSGASLTEILLAQNTMAYRNSDLGFYSNLLTKAGDPGNFVGADVAAQWYKRNIYMFSLIQKKVKPESRKIMVILGASHIAALHNFFKLDTSYQIVELKSILTQSDKK